jgi:hypothetical protein
MTNVPQPTDQTASTPAEASADAAFPSGRVLSPAAERALAEAAERRRTALAEKEAAEIGGRGGLDPVRYGDWEIRGLTADF